MTPLLVATDSQTLVWAIRRTGTQDQIRRARWLFQEIQREGSEVIIPSIVIAEYLVPTEQSQHATMIERFHERFTVVPFDIRCASLAATLFSSCKSTCPKGQVGARAVLKADTMIVATAIAHGACKFYSGDAGCRAIAERAKPYAGKNFSVFDLPKIGAHLWSETEVIIETINETEAIRDIAPKKGQLDGV